MTTENDRLNDGSIEYDAGSPSEDILEAIEEPVHFESNEDSSPKNSPETNAGPAPGWLLVEVDNTATLTNNEVETNSEMVIIEDENSQITFTDAGEPAGELSADIEDESYLNDVDESAELDEIEDNGHKPDEN